MKLESEKQNIDLKGKVLERLQAEQVQPYSKWFWAGQESLVWILWVASVIFGALSVAVLIFAATHARFALFEATHESPWQFALEVLPYIWIGAFVVMALLAYVNLRRTKHGYRYPFSHVVISSLLFSIGGGVLLNLAGVGYMIDGQLGERMPMYKSLEERESSMWQNPGNGRLVGAVKGSLSTSTVIFTDIDGDKWTLSTEDLHTPDIRVLKSGEKVRVLGVNASTSVHTLHACGVFPWMFEKTVSLNEMEEERQNFIERMYAHKDRADEREARLNKEVFGKKAMGLCADMPAIRRIGESMQ